jgi:hypothetical protein
MDPQVVGESFRPLIRTVGELAVPVVLAAEPARR